MMIENCADILRSLDPADYPQPVKIQIAIKLNIADAIPLLGENLQKEEETFG